MAGKYNLVGQTLLTPPKNLGAVASAIKNQFKGASINFDINADPKGLATLQKELRSIDRRVRYTKREYMSFTDLVASGSRRFAAITFAASTFIGLTRAVKRSVSEAIEYQKKMVTLSQVTEKSVE